MVFPPPSPPCTRAIKVIVIHPKSPQNCQLYDIKKGGYSKKGLAREMIAGIKSMVCMWSDAKEGFQQFKAYFWVPRIHAINASSRRLNTDYVHTVKQPPHKSLFLHHPQYRKCCVVPGLSSGAKQLFLKQTPAAALVTCSTDTPKMQHGQGWTSFGFLHCIQTCKTIPAGSGPSNVTYPFVSCC